MEYLRDMAMSGENTILQQGHGDTVRALSVSEDGRFVASAGSDSTVKVWSCETGRLIRTVETRALNVVSWNEAACRVATAEMNGQSDGGVILPGKACAVLSDNGKPGPNKGKSNSRLILTVINGKSVMMTRTEADDLANEMVQGTSSSESALIMQGNNTTSETVSGWMLSSDGWAWDKSDGSRRFWVPSRLRGIITSFKNRIVVLGTPAGHVVILHV